jgi:hypothetical protein
VHENNQRSPEKDCADDDGGSGGQDRKNNRNRMQHPFNIGQSRQNGNG